MARLTAALAAVPAPGSTGSSAAVAPAPVTDAYAEARVLASSGNKIQAIKLVREQSGLSLEAAKDLVESW